MENTTSSANEDDNFYSFMDKNAYVAVIDTIAFIGVVGNVIMFLLMLHSALRHQSYSTYLRFLAVFDTIVLVFTVTEDSIEKLSSPETLMNAFYVEKAKCYMWSIPVVFSRFVSPWILAGLSLDRCVTVMIPLRREVFNTLTRSHVYCVIVFLAAVLLQFMFVICDQESACFVDCAVCSTVNNHDIALSVYDMTVKTILPLIVIFVSNVMTIVRLRRAPTYEIGGYKRYSTTIALVMISAVSFIALFPKAVVEVIEIVYRRCCPDKLEGESGDRFELTWHITNALMLLNFAQNFYILVFSSKLHGKYLKQIFTCHRNWLRLPADYDRTEAETEMIEHDYGRGPLSVRYSPNSLIHHGSRESAADDILHQ